MGAWGEGVWESDTALDLRDDFEEGRRGGESVEAVSHRLLEAYPAEAVAMTALAEMCMIHGELPEPVRVACLESIAEDDLDDWRDPEARRAAHSEFLARLSAWEDRTTPPARAEGEIEWASGAETVAIDYTNHRGERRSRRIRPTGIRFGEAEWHDGPQWLLDAFDLDKSVDRTFAMRDVHEWRPG